MEKNDAWLKFWPNIKEGLLNSKTLTDDAANRTIALKTRNENIEKNFIREKLAPIIDIVNSSWKRKSGETFFNHFPITSLFDMCDNNFIRFCCCVVLR